MLVGALERQRQVVLGDHIEPIFADTNGLEGGEHRRAALAFDPAFLPRPPVKLLFQRQRRIAMRNDLPVRVDDENVDTRGQIERSEQHP